MYSERCVKSINLAAEVMLPFPLFQSNEPHETMPIAAFGQKQRPSRFFMTPPRLHYTPSLQSPITVSYFFHVILIIEIFSETYWSCYLKQFLR